MRWVCYNMYVIKREEKIHMNATYYMNKTTGEVTADKVQALEWYRGGDEVSLIEFCEVLERWVERCYWAH